MPLINRIGGGGADVSGVTATETTVLNGYTFVGADGEEKTGKIKTTKRTVYPEMYNDVIATPGENYLFNEVEVNFMRYVYGHATPTVSDDGTAISFTIPSNIDPDAFVMILHANVDGETLGDDDDVYISWTLVFVNKEYKTGTDQLELTYHRYGSYYHENDTDEGMFTTTNRTSFDEDTRVFTFNLTNSNVVFSKTLEYVIDLISVS